MNKKVTREEIVFILSQNEFPLPKGRLEKILKKTNILIQLLEHKGIEVSLSDEPEADLIIEFGNVYDKGLEQKQEFLKEIKVCVDETVSILQNGNSVLETCKPLQKNENFTELTEEIRNARITFLIEKMKKEDITLNNEDRVRPMSLNEIFEHRLDFFTENTEKFNDCSFGFLKSIQNGINNLNLSVKQKRNFINTVDAVMDLKFKKRSK